MKNVNSALNSSCFYCGGCCLFRRVGLLFGILFIGPGAMFQWLRALAALPEIQVPFPAPTWQFGFDFGLVWFLVLVLVFVGFWGFVSFVVSTVVVCFVAVGFGFGFGFWLFKTGFLCVVLAILELTL